MSPLGAPVVLVGGTRWVQAAEPTAQTQHKPSPTGRNFPAALSKPSALPRLPQSRDHSQLSTRWSWSHTA